MDVLAQLGWMDLLIILVLAVGVFIGFTQGMIRYVLNCIAVLVAFILASQLTGPIVDLLRFWTAFTPEGRKLLIFVLLFLAFVVGGWFAIRALYRRTRLPIAKQLDELGGAIFGLLWVALLITFHLLVFDTSFGPGADEGGWVPAYVKAMNDSLIVQFLRDTLVPTAGFLVRPFVPDEVARLFP